MNISATRALARCVVLESLRRKDLWVVAILGFVILLASSTLGFFGFKGLEIFAKDMAVTVLGMFSTIIAILTSSRLIPDEIKNRTLYPLLARPITRLDLLVGKLVGAVAVTWISFLLLAALTALALTIFHVKFEMIMLQYLLAKMIGLVVVCGFSMAFSVYMTPSASATIAFLVAFGAPMVTRGLILAAAGNPALVPICKAINTILPQTALFDLGGRAVYIGWGLVPLWVMGFLVAYGLFYSGAMLFVSWMKFRRQAV